MSSFLTNWSIMGVYNKCGTRSAALILWVNRYWPVYDLQNLTIPSSFCKQFHMLTFTVVVFVGDGRNRMISCDCFENVKKYTSFSRRKFDLMSSYLHLASPVCNGKVKEGPKNRQRFSWKRQNLIQWRGWLERRNLTIFFFS